MTYEAGFKFSVGDSFIEIIVRSDLKETAIDLATYYKAEMERTLRSCGSTFIQGHSDPSPN